MARFEFPSFQKWRENKKQRFIGLNSFKCDKCSQLKNSFFYASSRPDEMYVLIQCQDCLEEEFNKEYKEKYQEAI